MIDFNKILGVKKKADEDDKEFLSPIMWAKAALIATNDALQGADKCEGNFDIYVASRLAGMQAALQMYADHYPGKCKKIIEHLEKYIHQAKEKMK